MRGTTQVLHELADAGYQINSSYLAYLLRDRLLPAPERGPANIMVWSDADVKRLQNLLRRRGRAPERAVV